MRARFLHHLTRNAVAYLALIVALGGTSYAAVQLGKGQVKTRHLAKGSVTSSKVKNGTLKPSDFRRGLLSAGAVGPQGPAGQQGTAGAAGARGETGPPGPTASAAALDGGIRSLPQNSPILLAETTLTTTFASRILVNGVVEIHSNSPGVDEVTCGASVDGVLVGGEPNAKIEDTTTDTVDIVVLPVTGGGEFPAGTHTVAIRCSRLGVTTVASHEASLTAVATATG